MTRYIDADALIEKAYVMEYKDEWHMTKYGEFVELADVENAPTADVRPNVKGKWIDGHRSRWDGTFHWYRYCDQCGYERDDDDPVHDSYFCPNCGAELRGEEDE